MWLVTSADRWPQPEQFERLVSFAAGLAEDLFRAGKLTDVALDEGAPRPVRRVRDFESWLDELALVQPRRAFRPGEAAALPALRRKNVITFAPDGAQGVAAHVDGRKTATA